MSGLRVGLDVLDIDLHGFRVVPGKGVGSMQNDTSYIVGRVGRLDTHRVSGGIRHRFLCFCHSRDNTLDQLLIIFIAAFYCLLMPANRTVRWR